MKRPAIPITSPAFVWTSSHDTDIRKLFARVRAEQEQQAARTKAGIVPLRRKA